MEEETKSGTCLYYEDGHCTRCAREEELEHELKIANQNVEILKNIIINMCFEKYGGR